MARKKKRSFRAASLNEKLDQRNRIINYYRATGREATANRIMRGTTDVGGVIGNMFDRLSMRGIDPFSPGGMDRKVSFKSRTTPISDDEYNRRMSRIARGAIAG